MSRRSSEIQQLRTAGCTVWSATSARWHRFRTLGTEAAAAAPPRTLGRQLRPSHGRWGDSDTAAQPAAPAAPSPANVADPGPLPLDSLHTKSHVRCHTALRQLWPSDGEAAPGSARGRPHEHPRASPGTQCESSGTQEAVRMFSAARQLTLGHGESPTIILSVLCLRGLPYGQSSDGHSN